MELRMDGVPVGRVANKHVLQFQLPASAQMPEVGIFKRSKKNSSW